MIEPENVKALRNTLGETQAAFGRRFGVSQPLVVRWERQGINNKAHVMLVAQALRANRRKMAG